MTGLPVKLIADTLNRRGRRIERSHTGSRRIPRIHVSSLIKSGTMDAFCPREFVLNYFEQASPLGAGIPPKFQLLYDVGHFYGDYLVRQFIKKNHLWAKYIWGDWTCVCGATKLHRTTMPQKRKCRKCKQPVTVYQEVDLFNPKKTVVGHADLIFCVNGYFYVYEFKSIDRSDIVFTEINHPLGDHLLQASNYYWMLKAEGKKVSRRIRFVYIDRSMDDLYRAEPYREVSGDAISYSRLKPIYARAAACHTAIEKKKLPPRICDTITCSRAKQCSRAVSCFSRQKTTVNHIA